MEAYKVNWMERLKSTESYFSIAADPPDQYEEYNAVMDIIDKRRIKTVFQPIISLKTVEVYGYEALSRIVGPSVFSGPNYLFDAAKRQKLITQLEKLTRETALNRANELCIDKQVFFNIAPSVIDLPDHEEGWTAQISQKYFAKQSNVVLELTEKMQFHDNELFNKAIAYYKRQGFVIAIDDFGAGFAGLNMLLRVEPHIVKIDRYLIENIYLSTTKRLLLESIVLFCHKVDVRVVAEGIEKKEELKVALDMNVDFAQGYFLARPETHLQKCSQEARECIIGNCRTSYHGLNQNHNFIGSLVRYIDPVSYYENALNVLDRFKTDKVISSIPVVTNDIPKGIIYKKDLFQKFGQQYGFSVYSNRPVHYIMSSPLIFEYDTVLEDASLRILERSNSDAYDAVVIVKNGTYMGIVEVRDILARLTEQKMNMAVQANPLTGLPGNNIIESEITNRLMRNEIFCALYVDLDNFKPFNDHYGYERGDSVIRFLADILKNKIYQFEGKGFVGHIGGDDFVCVCCFSRWKILCQEIIESFETGIKRFHDKQAVQNGYYTAQNRRGEIEEIPLLPLSIGVVSNRFVPFESYASFASISSDVKKRAKKEEGNSYYFDQRRSFLTQ
jgi:diguanylate cyclase (GGDEF)-like protein